MKKVLTFFIKSILAGIMIAVGGTVFLSLDNKVLGAVFFSIGLFMIVTGGLNLYTGKVGYIFDNKPSYLIEVLTTVVGNFVGTLAVGVLLRFTRIYDAISTKAAGMCQTKLNDNVISILFLSLMCGMLMYLAVNGYKVISDPVGKYAAVFLGVVVFILCGFEHSIANMYYFSVSRTWSPKAFGYMGLMILGNACGGVLIPLCLKAVKKLSADRFERSPDSQQSK